MKLLSPSGRASHKRAGLLRSVMFLLPALLCMALAARTWAEPEAAANVLTEQEKTDGWKLLFDGKSLHGWRIFHKKTAGPPWQVENGVLVLKHDTKASEAGTLSGNLMTEEEFGDFELLADWRITPGANSGIFYHVLESGKEPNSTGIEYQILDNQRHPDGKKDLNRQTGAAYYMYPPAKDVTRPIGEWNTTRILVRGKHVEHWLNGEKLLEYELYSDDWLKRVAKSKFKNSTTYGRSPTGHILLQDHGFHVEFRNIKIKPLAAAK